MLRLANISIPGDIDLEISHHYGIEKFDKFGLVLLTLVNREYCKNPYLFSWTKSQNSIIRKRNILSSPWGP